MARLLPTLTATKLQAATYLLGIALFSISFLVFLNSSISFVVTDVIGQKERVGDAVGTLGFADELLALVACPLWGLLSDRIGVRTVAVLGYCIVGVSLFLLVQSANVYPELLLGRLGFSIGGAACTTMVTAVLPSMVARAASRKTQKPADGDERLRSRPSDDRPGRSGSAGHNGSLSVDSELTITPTRYSSNGSAHDGQDGESSLEASASTSRLAGFVGLFTGAGALVALALFLPLPAKFQDHGHDPATSVRESFYVVGTVALCVALFIFFGLRNLPGEEHKSLKSALSFRHTALSESHRHDATSTDNSSLSYWTLVRESIRLGFTDRHIGVGYLGGLVARASSVGVSLFLPLFVNAYFVSNGLCTSNPDNLTDIKENCKRAYTLAAALTGIAETAALLGAPIFGWIGARTVNARLQWPLMTASIIGILGYTGFGFVQNPDAFHGHGNARWSIIAVIAIGISQIGAIVCSLAVLGRGINEASAEATASLQHTSSSSTQQTHSNGANDSTERAPLLHNVHADIAIDRSKLKGTIAGVYSLLGGAGILFLTKAGGALFDTWTPGAPFFIMALFNALLLISIVVVGLRQIYITKLDHRSHDV